MKKQIVVAALVVSLIGGGVMGVTHTFAEGNQMNQEMLVQQLADKFKLNKSDVQGVFDAHRKEGLQQMQTNMDTRLTQAVKDGKITDAQKMLIENKLRELAGSRQTELDKLKTMTPAERKAEMEKQKQALEDFAKQNNIPTQYLRGGYNRQGGMKGHGMGKW